jgi:hypothetical protein
MACGGKRLDKAVCTSRMSMQAHRCVAFSFCKPQSGGLTQSFQIQGRAKLMTDCWTKQDGNVHLASPQIHFNNVLPGTFMFFNAWVPHQFTINQNQEPTKLFTFCCQQGRRLIDAICVNSLREAQEPFAWWEGAFNNDQLNWLQQQARQANQKAGVGGGGVGGVDPNIRRSDLNWLPNNQDTQWVFETLGHVVSSLNSQFFRFYLTGFGEHIQLTNYNSSEQGMYGWHVDMGPNTTAPCRKLSLCFSYPILWSTRAGYWSFSRTAKMLLKCVSNVD